MNNINCAWLTLNRNCNLRCKWCYAKSTGYSIQDNLDYDMACTLIDWIADLGISNLVFTGGEPTCYDRLFDVATYANEHLLQAEIVTNGILLSDDHYVKKLLNSGIQNIDISLKGTNRESYHKNTGVDAYQSAMKAIKNLNTANADFIVSIVLDGNNISDFLKVVKDAMMQGASSFYFSFCSDFSALDNQHQTKNYNIEYNVFHVIDQFTAQYKALDDLTSGKFILHQTFPMCLWDKTLIHTMSSKDQLATSCQFLAHTGLLFDTKGNIIPCNLMHQIKLGTMGKEYNSAESLSKYLNSESIMNFYKKVALTYPDSHCMDCQQWKLCGGGCVSNWLNFSFDELHDRYKKIQN